MKIDIYNLHSDLYNEGKWETVCICIQCGHKYCNGDRIFGDGTKSCSGCGKANPYIRIAVGYVITKKSEKIGWISWSKREGHWAYRAPRDLNIENMIYLGQQ